MSKEIMIQYWVEKAREDIASASSNLSEGRLQNTVRDAYFACFHAFAALLLKDGKSFKKHKEVRSALHRDYIRTGRIGILWGKHYDWLFENRQKADYRPWFSSIRIRSMKSCSKAKPSSKPSPGPDGCWCLSDRSKAVEMPSRFRQVSCSCQGLIANGIADPKIWPGLDVMN